MPFTRSGQLQTYQELGMPKLQDPNASTTGKGCSGRAFALIGAALARKEAARPRDQAHTVAAPPLEDGCKARDGLSGLGRANLKRRDRASNLLLAGRLMAAISINSGHSATTRTRASVRKS